MLEFKDSWGDHLLLIKFAYNNSYQANIGMAPYEALYGRKCRTLICWDEVSEWKLDAVELIEVTLENIRIIRDNLRSAAKKLYRHLEKRIGI